MQSGLLAPLGQRMGISLNVVSVQESIGQQAEIIPNLDAIAEFRIVTGNADAEYGGCLGGFSLLGLRNYGLKTGTAASRIGRRIK